MTRRPLPPRLVGGLRAALVGGALLLRPWGGGAAAQEVPAAAGVEPCEQGRISTVFVDAHSVFDLTDPDLNQRFSWAYRLANSLHVPTRESVVRTELLFAPGECYEVERLRDSERLLRALPFIADVDIFGVRQADGSIDVVVDTEDEWSTRVQLSVGPDGVAGVERLRLREDNLLGTGRHVSAFMRHDEEEQVYGATYYTPQLFDTRWDSYLEAGRTPIGFQLSQAITYPFVGEVGRWAWRQALEHRDQYFEYQLRTGDGLIPVWYPQSRRTLEFGGAYRWGTRGVNRTLLGAALTGEWISYPGEPRLANLEDATLSGVPAQLPMLPLDSVSSVRLMLMTGQRNVYYVRRRGLDTVNGTEDVQLGVEAELAVGPSIPGVSSDRDLALELGLFAGSELGAASLVGARMLVQGRRNYDTPVDRSEWSDVFGEIHAWSYLRTHEDARHLLVASVQAVGGWHNRVPFQLTLGADAGLRGYDRHLDPGARRVVASLEHRAYLGWPLPDLLDLGSVAFVDVGRIWAGDAPFGIDSPTRVDVGFGLRGAFPPGSRQTFRVDVGVPVRSGIGFGDVVVSVGVGQRIGNRAADRDRQLARSIRRGLSAMFTFPGQP